MATTDTNVPQVVVNKLTKAQYDAATKSPTEFYAVTDAKVDTADIQDGAITTAKIASGAVTSQNIDFTTLPKCTAYTTTQQSVPASSVIEMTGFKENVGGFTINASGEIVVPEAGLYLLAAEAAGVFDAGKGWIRVDTQDTQFLVSAIDRSNTATVYKGLYTAPSIVSLAANDQISMTALDAISNLNNGVATGTRITLVKIG